MAHQELETSLVNLLKNIKPSDRDFMSDSINMNLIHLIQKEQIQSVLFIYNAPFEASIDKTIIYCLNNNIDCYFIYFSKQDYPQIFKATTDNHDFVYYKYTVQAIPKNFAEKVSINTKIDLVISPVLAYDEELQAIDYHPKLNFIRLISTNDNIKKCGYCFSIQAMHKPLDTATIQFDYMVNEYKWLKK